MRELKKAQWAVMFIQFLFCGYRFLPFGEVKAHKVNNQIQEVLDALELSGVSPNIKSKAVFFFFWKYNVSGWSRVGVWALPY